MTENNTTEMTAAQMLLNARTTGRRKRELATIAKQLCIREEFLEALENGDYHKIPELVYVLGFARNYAMELGLDPEEIVAKIKREMGMGPDAESDSDDAAEEDVNPVAAPKASGARWGKRAMIWAKKYRLWIAGGAVLVIAAVAAGVIWMTMRPTVLPETGAADNAPVAAVVATDATPTYNLAVRERFGTENADSADIVLQANQEAWIKIEDPRGNNVFSRVLVPGDIYYVPAGGRHKATFGNAGGVDIWVNGRLAPRVGPDHVRRAGIVLNAASLLPASAPAVQP
ncbi:helix-turn-helix domain-containing protein [bacterium]|nr:helix-turn-helix domain-containing protein [bacterium]